MTVNVWYLPEPNEIVLQYIGEHSGETTHFYYTRSGFDTNYLTVKREEPYWVFIDTFYESWQFDSTDAT